MRKIPGCLAFSFGVDVSCGGGGGGVSPPATPTATSATSTDLSRRYLLHGGSVFTSAPDPLESRRDVAINAR